MREVEITLTDSEIEPREVRVHANEPVRLLVINFGNREHEFAVECGSLGLEIEHLMPGQTRALEHVFAEPGYFRTACDRHQRHLPEMVGTLVVEN